MRKLTFSPLERAKTYYHPKGIYVPLELDAGADLSRTRSARTEGLGRALGRDTEH